MRPTARAGGEHDRAAVVWRISDARPGHDNQSRGLVEALARHAAIRVCEFSLPARGAWRNVPALLRDSRDAPAPRLLLGAGHATHLPLLAARARRGGRAVVLMRPSLPRRLFDLCIVPAHDGLAPDERTLVTRGAINRVRPSPGGKDAGRALMLVGGPSREYGWSERELLAQVDALTGSEQPLRWWICDSRRTPPATRAALAALAGGRIEYVAHEQVPGDWLPRALSVSATVWVSEDSASMLYEALSAQAAVGLLQVPRTRPGRVAGGVDALRTDGLVRTFEQWQQGQAPSAPASALAEADRCARWLTERWLNSVA